MWIAFGVAMFPVVILAVWEDIRPHPEIGWHKDITKLAAEIAWERRWLKYFRLMPVGLRQIKRTGGPT